MNTVTIETLVDLKKKGVHVYLTEDGIQEFMKLMQEDRDIVTGDLNNEIAG